MYRQGKLEKALEQYDLVLKGFASRWVHEFRVARERLRGDAYAWKVATLNDLGRLDEALAVARKAEAEIEVITDPEIRKTIREASAKTQLWKGSLLARLGRAGEAMETLQGVVDKYPGTAQAVRANLILSEPKAGN